MEEITEFCADGDPNYAVVNLKCSICGVVGSAIANIEWGGIMTDFEWSDEVDIEHYLPTFELQRKEPYPLRINMDEQKTLDLYMEYIEAFESKDYSAIADRCRTPFFASSPSGTTIFGNREELVEGFSLLRGSLDIDGYVGSRLNRLDFTSVAETSGTLLVDFHRINHDDNPYFHGKALYIFQKEGQRTEIIGIVVLDDTTASSWND